MASLSDKRRASSCCVSARHSGFPPTASPLVAAPAATITGIQPTTHRIPQSDISAAFCFFCAAESTAPGSRTSFMAKTLKRHETLRNSRICRPCPGRSASIRVSPPHRRSAHAGRTMADAPVASDPAVRAATRDCVVLHSKKSSVHQRHCHAIAPIICGHRRAANAGSRSGNRQWRLAPATFQPTVRALRCHA